MRKMMILILAALFLGSVATVTSTTSMAAEQAKPITLTAAFPQPDPSFLSEQYKWWANEFGKRTGGKVTIKSHWMQSLVKYKDALPSVQSRFVDIAYLGAVYHPSNLPYFMMVDTLYNCDEDYVAAMLAVFDTVENEPHVKAEMEKNKIVMLANYHGGQCQFGSKKCISSVKDLQKKSIRTMGGVRAEFHKALGATPVPLIMTDIYEAVDRGTIDMWADVGIMPVHIDKISQVAPCVFMASYGSPLCYGVFMNADVFKSLPKDVQEMIPKLRRDFGIRFAQTLMELEESFFKEDEKKYGVKRIYPSAEDKKVLREAGQKANETFIKQQEAGGHKGAGDVVAYYTKALKKYEAERAKKK